MTSARPLIKAAHQQPFEIQAMVFEEDTYLVLSAGNHIRDIRTPLEELQREAVAQKALQPGDLKIRGSTIYAIIHDLDRHEPFSAEALGSVLEKLVDYVASAEITALGIQALGARHGPLSQTQAITQIESSPWPHCLERLWIAVTP